MIISNFLYRLGQWARENRAGLIRAIVIAAAAFALFFVGWYGVEEIQRRSYERGVAAKDKQFREADARARKHQANADALKVEIEAKDAKIAKLEKDSTAAKVVYERTKTVYVSLKDEYEKARDNPDVPADTTVADACTELAAIGHPCR